MTPRDRVGRGDGAAHRRRRRRVVVLHRWRSDRMELEPPPALTTRPGRSRAPAARAGVQLVDLVCSTWKECGHRDDRLPPCRRPSGRRRRNELRPLPAPLRRGDDASRNERDRVRCPTARSSRLSMEWGAASWGSRLRVRRVGRHSHAGVQGHFLPVPDHRGIGLLERQVRRRHRHPRTTS